MKKRSGVSILAFIGFYLLSCSDLTNPFLNKNDAKAEIVSKNFKDSDTVEIFSTKTLSICVYLREHIDSIKVQIDNNRLWNSPDTMVSGEHVNKDHSFSFSFYDTGWQNIRLVSYINNGDSAIDKCSLYAKSPLNQNRISGSVGDSVLLSTISVKDKVLYVWNLRNGVIIKETVSFVGMMVTTAFTSPVGELYVEDFSNHRSPVMLFPITTETQSELKLTCTNDSIKADSVYSPDADLKFSIEISGAQQLRSARVNGNPFDDSLRRGELFVLNYNLSGLDIINEPVALEVSVTDDLGRSVIKTFFVHNIKINPTINVAYPYGDSMQTGALSVNVLGTVTNIKQHSILYLFAKNNGKAQTKISITQDKPVFSFEISLPGSSNHISLELYSDSMMSGSLLTSSAFYVFYNPAHVDTNPPQIRNIRCNGDPVDSFFTSRTDTVLLEVDVVDNSNKLTVTVNGNTVQKATDELFFTTEVVLEHGKDSTIIAVNATDSAGYSVNDTIYVTYNRLPQWIKTPPYSVITAGEESEFQISAVDPDGDPLSVTMTIKRQSGDTILNASSGHVSWHPQNADIGEYTVKLDAWDGYEYIDTSFNIVVKGTGAVPIKFLTDENDFPDTLFVGDFLQVILKEIPLTGTRPFHYAAYFIDDQKSATILNGTDSVLHWIPTVADTGTRTLRVMIKDSLNYMDSIDVGIRVMKKILAYIKWENNHSPLFYENNMHQGLPKIILSKELNFRVRVTYNITFPNEVAAAKASDIIPPISGTITFDRNDTVASVAVFIVDDTIPEYTEKFEIRILDNDSIKFRDTRENIFHGEIIDDDLVTFYFEQTEDADFEKVRNLTATVKISKPLEKSLELFYDVDTVSSSAEPGKDFEFTRSVHSVVFDSGETEAVIEMNITNDYLQEENETIVLKLRSDSSFAKPRDTTGFIYTIINDDTTAHYSFIAAGATGSESDSSVIFRVTLDRKIDTTVVVLYSVDSDISKTTAILGTDFTILDNTGSIMFYPGETTKEIKTIIEDDTIPENDEFFTLNLQSESNLVLPGLNRSFQYTIRSNEVSVSINGNTSTVDEWTTNIIPITIQLSNPLDSDLFVYFQSDINATADSGSDYTVIEPNYVEFKAGETVTNMHFKIINDATPEGSEMVTFRIIGVSNKKVAYIGQSSWCAVTINDNDWPIDRW